MTSTNMFQGLDTGSKPSSRVLRPPGGGSSNLFGGFDEDAAASRRPNKMASTIFAPAEEPQGGPKRSNPPGGKTSGIFGQPEPPVQQQRPIPPGGATSNIFGAAESSPVQIRSHPNKPKDNLAVGPEAEPPVEAPQPKVSQPEVREEPAPPAVVPAKEEPPAAAAAAAAAEVAAVSASPEPTAAPESPEQTTEKNHEPHLGPRPRSHNRVLNPPGGKSSVIFY
ncbi:jupiter microtubule associated homolog 2 isoform X2 [Myripristis murdjan]|uniref:Jupiter microtubule associated homolog 2 n=1 Tax=Myripristis murdjan TaxID=586833 RepID=A0A667YH03_9TELE|nr:jupiter microtubule associated homolog 2 isoform X2 [Myripristis murdjan]